MYHIFGCTAYIRNRLRNAHSAIYDIQFCLEILQHLLTLHPVSSIEELYEFSEDARIPDIIPFGKYIGSKIETLPYDYCSWLLRQDTMDPYIIKAIHKYNKNFN